MKMKLFGCSLLAAMLFTACVSHKKTQQVSFGGSWNIEKTTVSTATPVKPQAETAQQPIQVNPDAQNQLQTNAAPESSTRNAGAVFHKILKNQESKQTISYKLAKKVKNALAPSKSQETGSKDILTIVLIVLLVALLIYYLPHLGINFFGGKFWPGFSLLMLLLLIILLLIYLK